MICTDRKSRCIFSFCDVDDVGKCVKRLRNLDMPSLWSYSILTINAGMPLGSTLSARDSGHVWAIF